MLKHVGGVAAVAGLVVGAWGCSGDGGGFEGTWQRIGVVDSSISLTAGEDGFHFRWFLVDGPKNIRCSREDFCEEFVGEDKVSEYTFRLEPEEDAIVVHVEARPVADETQAVTWVDRLTLDGASGELRSFLTEMNGEKLEKPVGPIRYVRTSDTPF